MLVVWIVLYFHCMQWLSDLVMSALPQRQVLLLATYLEGPSLHCRFSDSDHCVIDLTNRTSVIENTLSFTSLELGRKICS